MWSSSGRTRRPHRSCRQFVLAPQRIPSGASSRPADARHRRHHVRGFPRNVFPSTDSSAGCSACPGVVSAVLDSVWRPASHALIDGLQHPSHTSLRRCPISRAGPGGHRHLSDGTVTLSRPVGSGMIDTPPRDHASSQQPWAAQTALPGPWGKAARKDQHGRQCSSPCLVKIVVLSQNTIARGGLLRQGLRRALITLRSRSWSLGPTQGLLVGGRRRRPRVGCIERAC